MLYAPSRAGGVGRAGGAWGDAPACHATHAGYFAIFSTTSMRSFTLNGFVM